ncbi:hypothetical protein QEH59_15455 [Coraliomargarita sp. SDUM461004]|uniref:Uncharacterized protein n=1 Tax=Thalassobacterium sedimentorum TaxID=3041258 RepID=A0ABU1AMC9_9BACT|nr:hypothetical protein [Coraliomargarita sp. SDUM461004]MDQ8195829.1 hypothetical protein [Coraliomargarita sp. SDUM461004]
MKIQRQDTKQRMSRIVIRNDAVYLCGQVCENAIKDISEQMQTMLEKLDRLLLRAGSNLFCIIHALVILA